MDLREIWWEILYWMHLAQDENQWWAFVNTVMKVWVP
jgi:heme/copper-type cytochrome/quinol oxidase subunit 4